MAAHADGSIRQPAPVAASRQSAAIHTISEKVRRSAEAPPRCGTERGVALVVTLLMLSIITVVTVAFLALSQRERAAVGQATMQTTAEMAAETGRERATAQVMARILNLGGEQNLLGPGLFVSLAESNALNNLQSDPWVPVYVTNRANPLGEDRSHLDLNRNGLFDPSGFLPVVNEFGNTIPDASGNPWIHKFIGDPMWIGVLEHPDRGHAADNRFIARYCFIAVPAGQALDLNYIHNTVLAPEFGGAPNYDTIGYFRNQGFGTWEMNLAGFLADLNTNQWDYNFNPSPIPPNRSQGVAFDDALDFLKHRYTLFGQTAPIRSKAVLEALPAVQWTTNTQNFTNDFIDSFGLYPPMSLGRAYPVDPERAGDTWTNQPWAGAGNRRHFFSVHDYFTLGKGGLAGFSSRMADASTNRSSSDRYTFYRMLAQISTDTAPEQNPDKGKINLNYRNVDSTLTNWDAGGTNFQPWNARDFFLVTADRLLTNEFQRHLPNDLRYNTNIGLLNGRRIPIYLGGSPNTFTNFPAGPTNPPLYAPRIHQLLQMAANIYEATQRDKANEVYPYYPTVFHPVFLQDPNTKDIFLTDYEEIDPVKNGAPDQAANILRRNWLDLNDPNGVTLSNRNDNIYGIPMIFAARKGFPNFNEAAISTAIKVSRRVQLVKTQATHTAPDFTNVMFTVGISNVIGVEAWNSYSNGFAYPRELQMTFACRTETRLTNNGTLAVDSFRASNSVMTIPQNSWSGGQFRVPAQIYDVAVTNSALSPAGAVIPVPASGSVFFRYKDGQTNRLQLTLKNKIIFFLEETEPGPNFGRLIDAVSLSGMDSDIDISAALAHSQSEQYWRPNGVGEQVRDARSGGTAMVGWNGYSGLQLDPGEVRLSTEGLIAFLTTGDNDPNARTSVQVPFTPTERIGQLTKWSVNDPLVHYTLADLQPKGTNASQKIDITGRDYSIALTNNLDYGPLGKINKNAYRPWGTGASGGGDNPALKDAGVRSSDDWEFPEQKLPNVGWLGRIHRGTPWQTIYLKSADASTDWLYPAGNAWTMTTHPTNDWRLVDFFTTAPNDIATRGRLSINQTNLAAWSAVFSGIGVARLVESNTALGSIAMPVDDTFQPASADGAAAPPGVVPALTQVVNGINARRAQMPNKMFRTLGEFLSTPELTSASPFLDLPYTSQWCKDRLFTEESYLTDFELERLPAQMLGLVTVGEPRYVIYAWGQALQPAPFGVEYDLASGFMKAGPQGHPIITPQSIITSLGGGNLFRYCGNYQVTAEVATRTVLRIDVDAAGLTSNPQVRPRAVIESFNILPNE